MFGFGHRARNNSAEKQAMDTTEQNIVPIGLDDAHNYVMPGPTAFTSQIFGTVPYATSIGTDLPTIPNQDRVLVHYMQPTPYENNPQGWYNDRNEDRIYRGTQEHFFTGNIQETSEKKPKAVQPYLDGDSANESYHFNALFSPSNYRFVRPFDQQWERTNSLAQTGSEAKVMYPYAVGGMTPQEIRRNTWRLSPSARDIENMDLNDTHVASVVPAVYVSPQVQSSRWGL